MLGPPGPNAGAAQCWGHPAAQCWGRPNAGATQLFLANVGATQLRQRAAWGTMMGPPSSVYNAASQVTEVRPPRYFDSTDTNGFQKAREQWTYNGRGKVATHIVSPGTAEGASESYTYDLAGHQATHTDFAGNGKMMGPPSYLVIVLTSLQNENVGTPAIAFQKDTNFGLANLRKRNRNANEAPSMASTNM